MNFRRPRRPSDGRFAERDGRAWRRLIKAVRYQVRAPLAPTAPMRKAADACVKAVIPAGHATRDSVFLQLIMKARAFWMIQTKPDMPGAARELLGLAEACEAVLNADVPAPAPDRPPRADIFG